MPLRVQPLKLLSSFIKLDLSSLSFCNFPLKLTGFPGNLNSEFFDLKRQLLDLGLICSAILLESEIILLLLPGCEGPLFKLLLVPIHLKFELVHLLVSLENHVLDVVQAVLLVSNPAVELLDLILQTT